MFTGTLIEDLMATVERAEEHVRSDDVAEIESWLATIQENVNYDSKLVGVA